jgi:hypothetical protein
MTEQEELASLVKEIDQGAHLTDWEMNFIDDMLKLIEKKTPFSKKQGETIERIYKDRIG